MGCFTTDILHSSLYLPWCEFESGYIVIEMRTIVVYRNTVKESGSCVCSKRTGTALYGLRRFVKEDRERRDK
jgi:hypothetical protein